MKTIIAAIDFSKSSIHALEYAINIANKIGFDIIMVWVDKQSSSEKVFPNTRNEYRNEAKRNLKELINKYKGVLIKGKLSYKLRKGKVYNEIANQAKDVNAELIVTGAHGISGFEQYWIGSNANRIVTYAPCPVITVKYGYNLKSNIDKIVLPIDNTAETLQKLPFTSKIAKYFNSEIHILVLYSTSVKAVKRRVDNYSKQVVKLLEEQNIKYHIESMETENVTNSAIEFTEKVNADLISIMTEQGSSAANILLGPSAQQMVNNSPVPVLTIHAKEFTYE